MTIAKAETTNGNPPDVFLLLMIMVFCVLLIFIAAKHTKKVSKEQNAHSYLFVNVYVAFDLL